jgi:EmrB/QacA subfamily drug resistance transporter
MNFSQLVIFRIFQGLGGGLAIPIGLSMIMTAMPHDKWAKTGAWMNLFTLLAPALGPILGGYITSNLSWRWLFFIKLPISFVCVLLSHFWVRKMARKKEGKFDWLGFYFAAFSLSLILLVFSEAGKNVFTNQMLIFLFCLSLVLFGGFIWQERRASNPLVPLKIFKNPLFAWGNVIQSAANMIFLGATFITALYLQWGLGFDIIKTGWIMAAITIGMMAAMPLTGKFYNQIGPLPFIIPGLILMAFAMFALIFVTPSTSPWLIALLILCEGFGSAALQATNFVSIFTEIPHELKGAGSALYALFKQISASLGVALSTMALSFSMVVKNITNLEKGAPSSLFYPSFILLGIIPLLALPLCLLIDNRRALKKMQKMDHLETEFEEATE